MKFKRVMALLAVIIITLLFVLMIIAAFTDSAFFLPLLYLTLIVPILLFIMSWLYKLIKGDNNALDEAAADYEEEKK